MQRYITLLRVIDLQNITKAAQDMGYTQSAVSQMIQSLEKELQLTLVTRSRNGVRLTREGAELYPYIERMVNEYYAMMDKDKEILGLEGGLIRIGTLSSYSSQWLPAIIKEFQVKYPGVKETVFIREGNHSAILPRGHRLAGKKVVTLQELAEEPYIQLETGELSEPIEAFHALGLEPDIELRMHDNFSVCTMVEAGIGVSVMPNLALKKMNFDIVILPTEPMVKRKVAFAMKKKELLPIASQRFIDFFMERIRTFPVV